MELTEVIFSEEILNKTNRIALFIRLFGTWPDLKSIEFSRNENILMPRAADDETWEWGPRHLPHLLKNMLNERAYSHLLVKTNLWMKLRMFCKLILLIRDMTNWRKRAKWVNMKYFSCTSCILFIVFIEVQRMEFSIIGLPTLLWALW